MNVAGLKWHKGGVLLDTDVAVSGDHLETVELVTLGLWSVPDRLTGISVLLTEQQTLDLICELTAALWQMKCWHAKRNARKASAALASEPANG